MPPDEPVISSTTTGASITGSAIVPANAVEAAAVRAAASTSFFILTSRIRVAEKHRHAPKTYLVPLSNQQTWQIANLTYCYSALKTRNVVKLATLEFRLLPSQTARRY